MPGTSPAVEDQVRELRAGFAPVRRTLARLGDPPEPLTAAELARRAVRDPLAGAAIPEPPESEGPPGALGRAAAALRAGEVSAVELVADALGRAEAASGLNAFIRVCPEAAAAAAKRADAARGPESGPLLGIPLSVKDIVDVAGMVTTSGSRFPREPAASAPAWRSLESRGAILIGKTNLQEFAFGVTGDNPVFGRTRNPRDPERIPGGSSSGSAAATAAGIGYGSLGTDTGGSIRIPAALTGVFGLKPSFGVVSRIGVTPLSWSLDHVGPIARSARDLALLFEALAEAPAEKSPAPARGSRPLAGVRYGVLPDFFSDRLVPEARAALERVEGALGELGAAPVALRVPEAEIAGVSRTVLAFAEAAAAHRERLASRPGDLSEGVRTLLEVGRELSADELLAALSARRLVADAFARVFEECDALVVPTTPAGAPLAGEERLATGEPLRPGLMRFVGPFNFTGLPALQIPAGRDGFGMPLGVQLVTAPGGDRAAIRLAGFLEASGAASLD